MLGDSQSEVAGRVFCTFFAAADIGKIVLESPQLKKQVHNSQVEIWGLLHCISPPFVLPSKASPLGASVAKSAKSFAWNGTQKSIFEHGSAGQTMLGFIVELRMCPHLPSCEHNALLPAVGKQCVHVYFSGSVASWRPVLSVVIGQCVTITGFQRKLILVGTEKNEHFLFVATKHSLVSQLSPSGRVPMDCGGKEPYFRAREMDPTPSGVTRATIHKELVSDSKEGARIGSYVGIVTDIPMPGQLVELNKQAWLLLTHYNVSQLHRLHVGAMASVAATFMKSS
ncbi:unnamed protein product [Sphagnum jensenii]|uniref:CST complex subunit CTC1 n=1 Tax=Sphagnum jensenii TaxID=128206 RepID=A0ABP1AKJ6_9BRYO